MGKNLIGENWVEGQGEEFASLDPFTDQNIWSGRAASAEQVEQAFSAARGALSGWSSKSVEARCLTLQRFAELLEQREYQFAELISKEMGKPLWEAKTEVLAMCAKVAVSVEAHNQRCAEKSAPLGGGTSVTRFKPHGVVGVFGPFNFPGHLPNGHIIPALIAGNTVVFKPSEQTPAVGQMLVELYLEAGLPAGVVNLVQGSKDTGIALAASKELDGLYFTGSSEVGGIIHNNFAGRPDKILALEMGGNNPLVVWNTESMSDTELRAAVYTTIQSAFITSGQRCTCARRLIVQEGISDSFVEMLVEKVAQIRPGHFSDQPEPFSGPLINPMAGKNLLKAEEELVNKGGKILVALDPLRDRVNLLRPGIIDVSELKSKEDKEVFGPLLQLSRVKNFESALTEANNTSFGLAAALLSPSRDRYEDFYSSVRAGIVNWNRQTTGASSRAPFGGVGMSGNHRPAAWFAADYCSFPVASVENNSLDLPEVPSPGLKDLI